MTFPAPPSGSLQHFDLMAVATAQVVEQPPSFLLREDGKALFYPATINSLQGEPGAGKTWVAHAAGAGVVRAGGFAVFLDYEDAPSTAASRLLALGLDISELDRVGYFQVAGPWQDADVIWLTELVKVGTVELVVLDSVPESLAAEGADENHSRDVGRWAARLPRLLARAGACVLLVDHVTKAEEGRGRWARAAGRSWPWLTGPPTPSTFRPLSPGTSAGRARSPSLRTGTAWSGKSARLSRMCVLTSRTGRFGGCGSRRPRHPTAKPSSRVRGPTARTLRTWRAPWRRRVVTGAAGERPPKHSEWDGVELQRPLLPL